MSDVFRLHVLPAQRGDALWIEYGPADGLRHVLIDGGITDTGRTHLRERLASLPKPLHIELLVITHIDLDHIQGVLQLLEDLPDDVSFGDIWFNGWDQLQAAGLESMGVKEGIRLSEILARDHSSRWNRASSGKAISLKPDGSPVTYKLLGGMEVSVLSPGQEQLVALRDVWDGVLESFGAAEDAEAKGNAPKDLDHPPDLEPMGVLDVRALAERKFREDATVPNGSSIALLLTFDKRSVLLLGDAYPSVVAGSLKILKTSLPVEVGAVKLSHHGSRSNTDRGLAEMLQSPYWIFSSNGANNTKHPHPEAVARVLYYGKPANKKLFFNYRTQFNELWDDAELTEDHGYTTEYGDGTSPVIVNIA